MESEAPAPLDSLDPAALPPTRWWHYALVVFLLLLHFVLAVTATRDKSLTFDEPFHVIGGYTVWRLGDHRMAEAVGVAQVWMTLPLKFLDLHYLDTASPAFQKPYPNELGQQFLFGLGNDVRQIALVGRRMIALLSVALGLLVWHWSRQLFGPVAGLIALGLYALNPSILANAGLMTTDIAASLFLLLATWCLWRLFAQPSPPRLLASVLACTALCLTKSSGVLIIPIAMLLGTLQWLRGSLGAVYLSGRKIPLTWMQQLLCLFALGAFHLILGAGLIWSFYGFQYDAFRADVTPDSAFRKSIDEWLQPPGAVSHVIAWTRDLQLLPEPFLYSFAHYYDQTQSRPAFMNGHWSTTGWWTFFPYTVLLKTPLPMFAVLALALLALTRARPPLPPSVPISDLTPVSHSAPAPRPPLAKIESLYWNLTPLWVLLIAYGLTSLTSSLNIGHRHILPLYPLICILCGAAASWIARRGCVWRGALGLSILAYAVSALLAWPNYLSYFNILGGGPLHAHEHLVDSSLDWGQDLPALARDLKLINGSPTEAEPVYLAYFGTAEPNAYGVQAANLLQPTLKLDWQAGWYCLSATFLEGVGLGPRASGPWTPQKEERYRKLETDVAAFYSAPAARRQEIASARGADAWRNDIQQLAKLRIVRLAAYLRTRPPDRHINGTIFLFRLSKQEIEAALQKPVPMQDEK